MEDSKLLIRVLLNTIKLLLNNDSKKVDEIQVDHDTPNFNIKIEITKR
jgi:hypothetical protein